MQNIFVVGLDDFHLAQLRTLPGSEEYAFHPLFSSQELKERERFPVRRMLEEVPRILRDFPGSVDAIVGYWDFPVSTALPILRRPLGLPGPTLEAVLQCEHKYWSRIGQAEVVPELVPRFCAVDPFAEDPLSQICLDFPFWLKPVKAVLSHLGYRIDDGRDFAHALEAIRGQIPRYAEPFNLILQEAELPPGVAKVDGYHCIAESIISEGVQCTQEGYAFGDEVRIYGTIDSLRAGPQGSSFSRYQYPSVLPASVTARMTEVSRRVVRHLGYDCAPFNIEYFWEENQDRLWLLEINARLSKSHAPLFRLVDGHYHHQVMVELGLGQRPRFRNGQGEHALAAKFMARCYGDAEVKRLPSDEEIAAVEAAVPGTQIQMQVSLEEGMQLSELRDQESYSFEVATVFVGGADEADLEAKFRACMERLPLELEPTAETLGCYS